MPRLTLVFALCVMSHLTVVRAREILSTITQADDGAHASELFELINGVADENNQVAEETLRFLYTRTSDFEDHFQAFKSLL